MSENVVVFKNADLIPSCSENELATMRGVNDVIRTFPQVDVPTDHFIHAGCYARTCLVKAGVLMGAAEIIVPTVLVVSGKCEIFNGGKKAIVDGFVVLRGEPHRQVAVKAITDTYMTMIYATDKTDPVDCEEEFTDQTDQLFTRR